MKLTTFEGKTRKKKTKNTASRTIPWPTYLANDIVKHKRYCNETGTYLGKTSPIDRNYGLFYAIPCHMERRLPSCHRCFRLSPTRLYSTSSVKGPRQIRNNKLAIMCHLTGSSSLEAPPLELDTFSAKTSATPSSPVLQYGSLRSAGMCPPKKNCTTAATCATPHTAT